MSKEIEINFNIHIPYALKNFRIFDVGNDLNLEYFDEEKTKEILDNFSEISYLKVNKILYDLIKISKKKFIFSLNISGISIEIMKKFSPKLLNSFQKLIKTGQVQIRSSYYNSISTPISSKPEILEQVQMHKKIVEDVFNVKTIGFLENTSTSKFQDFNIESCNYSKKINSQLVKTIKFNYDSFGIENSSETGIFNFLKHFPNEFLKQKFNFVIRNTTDNFNLNHENKFLIKNKLQESLMSEILNLENLIKNSNDSTILSNWRKIVNPHLLNQLDLDYFNKNKKNNFMHFNNHYDVYLNIKNIIEDMKLKLNQNSNQIPTENLSNSKMDII